jgi:hypothetical protein
MNRAQLLRSSSTQILVIAFRCWRIKCPCGSLIHQRIFHPNDATASELSESVSRKRVIVGDRYWSPVNVSTSTPTELNIIDPEKLKQDIVIGRVPEVTLKFAKDETKTFKVDLTKTVWNDAMYSMWPNETLFKIVRKGSYSLSLTLRDKGVNVESNAVQVSVR